MKLITQDKLLNYLKDEIKVVGEDIKKIKALRRYDLMFTINHTGDILEETISLTQLVYTVEKKKEKDNE